MKLTNEQQSAVRERFSICVNEACDTCTKPLNFLRYVRKNEGGEWCSRLCRDGQAAADRHAATRKGIRAIRTLERCLQCNLVLPTNIRMDAKYCDASCKKAFQRAHLATAA